jgi:cytochrome c
MKFLLVSLGAAVCLLISTAANADQALATARGCMTCHGAEKQIVGPAYKDIAAKYKGQADAAARLATEIVKGTGPKGVGWQKAGKAGMPFMPPNPGVSEADAKKLAAWVLTQK